jgi:glycosyltransferase involved in cell wall biosynthesis
MLAKKFNAPLFSDLRDIFEQTPDNSFMAWKSNNFIDKLIIDFYRKINIKRRNKVLKKSTCVTSVSNWHVQFLKQFNPSTHLIYNGFDENLFIPQIQKTDKFFISYFGEIYYEKLRNPNILCAALKNLEKNEKITLENCCVKWFVGEKSKYIIQKVAKKHNVEDFMSYEKQVENEQYVLELNKNSVLLVLCNSASEKKYSGIMTTKFFDYIGVNLPILCTPNNNDELAGTINEIGCGLASSDVVEVENFIMEKYAEWQKNGFTKGTILVENREKFSRKNGAEILEKLFLEVLK